MYHKAVNAALHDVQAEMTRAEELHGNFGHKSLERCHTILSEEMGELAEAIIEVTRVSGEKAIRKKSFRDVYEEAIQVAATATRIAEKVRGYYE